MSRAHLEAMGMKFKGTAASAEAPELEAVPVETFETLQQAADMMTGERFDPTTLTMLPWAKWLPAAAEDRVIIQCQIPGHILGLFTRTECRIRFLHIGQYSAYAGFSEAWLDGPLFFRLPHYAGDVLHFEVWNPTSDEIEARGYFVSRWRRPEVDCQECGKPFTPERPRSDRMLLRDHCQPCVDAALRQIVTREADDAG